MSEDDNSRQKATFDDAVLTLSETAAYLKLGERTVQRMIQRKEIPCVRLGGQWRFMKPVLDDWLISGMQALPRDEFAQLPETVGNLVRLTPLINPELIVDRIRPGGADDIVHQLVAPLVARRLLRDPDRFIENVLARERLSSTAIGHGVAVPHVRRPGDNPEGIPAVLLGRCREGVAFGAVDESPVHFFFLLGTTSEVVHIRVLKRISMIFRDRSVRDALLGRETTHEMLSELAHHEERIFPGGRYGA